MSKRIDHNVVDEMNTRFRMKIGELAVQQADKIPFRGSKLEVTIDHQVVSAETGIIIQTGASHYIVQFVKGPGYWDLDRILAYE